MTTNIVTAVFGAFRVTRTDQIYQYNYGQILRFKGIDLPATYTVHFSNQQIGGDAVKQVGNADGVQIPNAMLISGQNVYAWVFLHVGADDGETMYAVTIPVKQRPRPTEEEPTPVQQGLIEQAIAALNAGVEAAQEAAGSVQDMGVEAETLAPGSPLNVVKTIDPETGAVTLTFYLAPGRDGVSPTIAVTEITGGHRVTITDAQGTRTFDVMDGTNGDDGRGIASAVMNADYTLTLTYTDGTSYTTPSLRGDPGQDGYSPLASVSKVGKVATISITDRQGTTMATVSDGEDGTPGVSPTITVTDITGGHRVTITDETGPHSFDVMDGTGSVQDVQVAGTSVVQDGVANVPKATTTSLGVVKAATSLGTIVNSDGTLYIYGANTANIKAGNSWQLPIVAVHQHESTFYGLAKAAGSDEKDSTLSVGQYTDAAKSAISQMLNGSVAVTGTTPNITALSGIRYVCGEVATLDITLPASGIVDVVFESGSTPTVLTVTPPTGVTVKWANGFDPSSLEANTTYEINIMDGEYGVVGTWT